MKGILILLTLFTSLNANATHWLTYYVYFETEYLQGPWSRTDILEKSKNKYLTSVAFEDLFGTVDADLVGKMLARLKNNKPETYDWTYDLSFRGDTVILTTKDQINELETVKNEITATLTLNNFKAVTFRFHGGQETWTIDDLTLPYLDLVMGQPKTSEPTVEKEIKETTNTEIIQNKEKTNKESNPLFLWLVISGIVNIGLIMLLTMKKKKYGA